MALSHAFPWRMATPLIDARQELKRIPSYTIGTLIILSGMLMWCISTGDYIPVIVLAILDIAGGLGAIVPRVVTRADKALEDYRKNAQKLQVYEKADHVARPADNQEEQDS